MRIPLIEFEDCIDPAILKRGRSYFKEGRVAQCEEIDSGIYEAVVVGTDDYTVRLMITDGIVAEYACDCPYDLGPVCKHFAAVIIHLRQSEAGHKNAGAKPHPHPRKTKRKTVADRVIELLDKVPHDELKQFIRENASDDRGFREMFLSSFAHLGAGESKAVYVSQVKAALRSAAGKHGFIDWRIAGHVGAEVSRLLDAAKKHLDAQNYITSIHICTAVMEQMVEALQYGDDSNGDLGGVIGYAFELLQDIAEAKPADEIRVHLFDYCLGAFDEKIYVGWDWHFDMLDLASELTTTEKEAQLILDRLEKGGRTEYDVEIAQCMTYQLLRKVRSEAEAEEYLAGHISNPGLRRAGIEKAIENKQFDRARSLAEAGIKQHKERLPGLVLEWKDWFLKTAQAERNTEEIIKYARLLFIDGFRREQDYYALMQKHVGADQWPEFVEALIRDLTVDRGRGEAQLPGIYIKEGMWDRLLALVKQSPVFYTLDAYEKYLKKDYASDLADMYAEAVLEYLDERYNVGRNHYQKACRYIRRIKKLGSSQRAENVIATLRAKYPQRRALLEELEMI